MTDIPLAQSLTKPLTKVEADEAEAAEYVLGLQDAADRAATQARVSSDGAFAQRVFAWETRLQDLNDGYAPATSPRMLPKLEARLFPRPRRAGLGVLRWLAGAGVAAALVLVTLATLVPPRSDLIAVLATSDARLVLEVRHAGSELAVTRTVGPPAVAGRVHEIWLIAPDAAPVSLGLLAEAPLVVAYPRPPDGWGLAVSIEPEGGSRYGTPTGPVILRAVIGREL